MLTGDRSGGEKRKRKDLLDELSSPSETGYEDTQRTDHHPSLICPLHSFKEPKAVLVSQEASGDAGQLRVRRSDASDCTAERRVESDGHRESSDPVEKGSAGIQQKPADEAIRQTEYLANTRIPAQGWIQACRCQRKVTRQTSKDSSSTSKEESNSISVLSAVSESLPFSAQMQSLTQRQQICQDALSQLEATWAGIQS